VCFTSKLRVSLETFIIGCVLLSTQRDALPLPGTSSIWCCANKVQCISVVFVSLLPSPQYFRPTRMWAVYVSVCVRFFKFEARYDWNLALSYRNLCVKHVASFTRSVFLSTSVFKNCSLVVRRIWKVIVPKLSLLFVTQKLNSYWRFLYSQIHLLCKPLYFKACCVKPPFFNL
jgi:hypothetical protein